ncbi:hypothetical protein B0H11DRAFT_1353088 [Mycena galericulata]|nr:hypothetical protein B0H11DRAFT_1353088 [Mycena galericulata]
MQLAVAGWQCKVSWATDVGPTGLFGNKTGDIVYDSKTPLKKYQMPMSLSSFPEELLERILAATVIAPPSPHPRAPWHPRQPSHSKDETTRSRLAPLLVCRAFHRIALPLFYHTLVLHSPSQASKALHALNARPALARSVRTLVLPAPGPGPAEAAVLARLLASCAGACNEQPCTGACGLRILDVTLPSSDQANDDGLALASAVRKLRGLRSLVVRKAAGTYLSQPAPRALLAALAELVAACPLLTHTKTTFPLSADPALAPLVTALAAAPALSTLCTPAPALWAPALLTVSANGALSRICLGAAAEESSWAPASATAYERPRAPSDPHPSPYAPARPLLGTSLFLSAARKHSRLAELIRAGAYPWRGRAWTVGAVGADGQAYQQQPREQAQEGASARC